MDFLPQEKINDLKVSGEINSILDDVIDVVSSAISENADKILTLFLSGISKYIDFQQACFTIECGDPLLLTFLNSNEKMEVEFNSGVNIPVDGTVSGWVFKNRAGLILNDIHKDPRFLMSAIMESSRYFNSCVSVPLYSSKQPVGSFTLWARENNKYTNRELLLMERISRLISIALVSSRVYVDGKKRTAELYALMQVGETLSTTMEIDKLSRSVIEELDKVISFPYAGLYLYDEESNTLELVDAKGVDGEEIKISQEEMMNRHPGIVIRTKEPLIVNDVSTDSRIRFPEVDGNYERPSSLCYIPMIYQGKCFGIIGLASPKKNYFTPNHVRLVSAAAKQVAIAFSRARLYQREREIVNNLQDVNKFKDEFIANVSHELRTPLTAVIGFSYLLTGGRLGELTPTQKELINDILISAQNMLHLVEDLLDLSKLQARKIKLDKSPTDLKAIVEEVIVTTRIMAQEISVSIESYFEGDFSCVYVDPNRLRQVIMNLVTNAIKFNREKGYVKILLQDKGDYLLIKVSDSGVGIKKEEQSLVFEQFRQLESVGARRFRGTGLGLSITKELIELHGGQISLKSEPGKGTDFIIIIPKIEGQKVPVQDLEVLGENYSIKDDKEELSGEKLPKRAKLTILSVEDDKSIRRILEALLGEDYNFITAKDGIEGVASALRYKPDLILMDLALPDMDGYETTTFLKSNSRTAGIPVIALTARVTEEDMDKASLCSFERIINKPFDPDKLVDNIRLFFSERLNKFS